MSNSRIIDNLSKYILTDGFHVVVDIDKSEGSYICDAETGDYDEDWENYNREIEDE